MKNNRLDFVRAAAHDAGNRHALLHGRHVWTEDDWNIACAEYDRLLQEINPGSACNIYCGYCGRCT